MPALGTVNRRAPDSSDTVRALADTDLDFVVFDVEGGVKDMTQFAASLAALAESAARRPARGPIAPLVRIPKTSNGSPEETVRRCIGTQVEHVGELCRSLLKVANSITNQKDAPVSRDVRLLQPLSNAIRRGLAEMGEAAEIARRISQEVNK